MMEVIDYGFIINNIYDYKDVLAIIDHKNFNKLGTKQKQQFKKYVKTQMKNKVPIKNTKLVDLINILSTTSFLSERGSKNEKKYNFESPENILKIYNKQERKKLNFKNNKEKSINQHIRSFRDIMFEYKLAYSVRNDFNRDISDSDVFNNDVSEFYVEKFFNILKEPTLSIIRSNLNKFRDIKIQLSLRVTYFQEEFNAKTGEITKDYITFYTATPTTEIHNLDDIDNFYINSIFIFLNNIESNLARSNLKLYDIDELYIKIIKIKPLVGGTFIKLPKWIENKKAVINPKNDDEKCFKYAILIHIHRENEYIVKQKTPNEVKQYLKLEDNLNWSSCKYPMKIDNIKNFEKDNNLTINVYYHDNKSILPLKVSRETKNEVINLLYIQDKTKSHYAYIKNFDRLFNTRNGENVRTDSYKHCMNCLTKYKCSKALLNHQKYCLNNKECAVNMPPPNTVIKFTNQRYKIKNPFTFYCDFESFLEEVNDNNGTRTVKTHIHKPASWFIYRKCVDIKYDKTYMYKDYPSDNIVQGFLQTLINSYNEIEEIFNRKTPMIFTEEDEKLYNSQKVCHICDLSFDINTLIKEKVIKPPTDDKDKFENEKIKYSKVRDHDHFTGLFRGAAHCYCNLLCTQPKNIPVIFHNLKGYDAHHIIKNLHLILEEDDKLQVIPTTKEKFISFTYKNLRFIDSFAFLQAGLDSLIENQKVITNLEKMNQNIILEKYQEIKDNKLINYKNLKNTLRYYDEKYKDFDKYKMLLCKGEFFYEYMKNETVFKETEFPRMEAFNSILGNFKIKEEAYNKEKDLYIKFECKNLQDYHDIYLERDVLLLCDVFENFRDDSLTAYGIDPTYNYTMPGMSWQCMLKNINKKNKEKKDHIEIELMHDYDMFLMIEKGIRGGNSMIAHRYSEANNKYMNNYDEKKDDKFIFYIDACNLYGWAMMQKLPYSDLKFQDVTIEEALNWNVEGSHGCILEVDLDYPKEIHDIHSMYPLAPEKMIVENKMLSPFQINMKETLDIKEDKVAKLLCTLYPKKNYVLHIKNLQLYCSLGMKLTKIHRTIVFKQDYILRDYIQFNSNKRQEAKSEAEKDMYKLMNNALFGKTMQNQRTEINYELVHNQQRLEKLASKINFNSADIITEEDQDSSGLVGVQMNKMKITLNKPIYLGMSILDLSKTLMYDMHYNTILKKYKPEDVKLLFTDTDSLCYEVKTKDIFDDMKNLIGLNYFDVNDYPKDHEFCNEKLNPSLKQNKKRPGKFTEELKGISICTSFAGLRSKMYSMEKQSLVNDDISYTKKCKGVKKYIVNKSIHFDDYKRAIFHENIYNNMIQTATMHSIRSFKHEINTICQNKISLSSYDNKRYLLNSIESLPYGHYKCQNS